MCSAVVAMLLVLASITPTQDKGAGNERDRRHKNRAQAQAARLDRGLHGRHPFLVLFVLRELDDQDRVFAREPYQDDETDLRENVVVAATYPNARNREKQTHRNNKYDCQRQAKTLVERRQHQVNQ